MPTDAISFSEEQQAAVLGHALLNPAFAEMAGACGMAKAWFLDTTLPAVWEQHEHLREKYARPPTVTEVRESLAAEEPAVVRMHNSAIERCLKAAQQQETDILRAKLRDWAKSRVLISRTMEISTQYNDFGLAAATAVADKMVDEIRQVDSSAGAPADRAESADKRVETEREGRIENGAKLLSYGIAPLDDALLGIPPTDVILLVADSGVGKTQAAKIIAQHVVEKQKKRVTFFALEADENEIEQRIKWSLISRAWKRDHQHRDWSDINYSSWMYGQLEKELGKYGEDADRYFKANLKGLKTYYRVRGDFSIETLKREIRKNASTTDLFVLDHFHYVDTEGENENAEQMSLAKEIRHTALDLKIPFVVVVHIRKKTGGGSERHTLLPTMSDIHGSSNIYKIAKTILMFGRANGVVTADPRVAFKQPTLMGIRKCRLDGSRLYHTALGLYNANTGEYEDHYQLGVLHARETKWRGVGDEKPRWARRAENLGISKLES